MQVMDNKARLRVHRPYLFINAGRASILSAAEAFLISYAANVAPKALHIVNRRIKYNEFDSLLQDIREVLRSGLKPSDQPFLWAAVFAVCAPINLLYTVPQTQSNKKRPTRNGQEFLFVLSFTYAVVKWHNSLMAKSTKQNGISDSTAYMFTTAADYVFRRTLGTKKQKQADTLLFVISCYIIMYCWFYRPERLPKSYNIWITRMANMDTSLLNALRLIEKGKFVYGKETGCADILGDMCDRVGLPRSAGDPTQTVPIPCQLVHGNISENCELHALFRFWTTLRGAASIYVPLNIILALRSGRRGLLQIVGASLQSSVFLSTFVTSIWYSVCLTRTRLGPWLFPRVSAQKWDDKIGPCLGCLMCGWSVLIEKRSRIGELALFVLPRALLATMNTNNAGIGRFNDLCFSISTAILAVAITSGRKDSVRPRGIVGAMFSKILD
ncbi:uncharacterized protein V1510DRAFT_421164 [Dipodascopsis tothii]|uniref:uncharacterized protein n=1 Tax=Dipodascopsis tothii TaxID=44089 RepID=UPI0034CF302C